MYSQRVYKALRVRLACSVGRDEGRKPRYFKEMGF